MRAHEFIVENSTVSGSIATVSLPLGSMITRLGFGKPAKYSNSYSVKKRKQNAGR